MRQKEQVDIVHAFPFKITLRTMTTKDKWKTSTFEKNHIKIFVGKRGAMFVTASIYDKECKLPLRNSPVFKKLICEINDVIDEKSGKKKKTKLYDLLVDILESFGFTPPLVELEYELVHNHAHWIEMSRNYYYAAKILERNYNDVMQIDKIRKRKSKKFSKRFEETYYTDRIVIYLYSRAIECILKSRIYYKLENVYEFLTDKKKIIEKRQIKKWAEKKFILMI